MPDRQTDPNPDSPPRDDDRGSVESLDQPDAGSRASEESPDPANGAVGGTDGVTKNQGDDAQ